MRSPEQKAIKLLFRALTRFAMFSTIKLKDYFEFYTANDIRIKGHRIGIQDVLNYYLEGYTPEEINLDLPTLNLEKIHATITFYLHNKLQIDEYLERLEKDRRESYQRFITNPPAVAKKVQAEKARRNARKSAQ